MKTLYRVVVYPAYPDAEVHYFQDRGHAYACVWDFMKDRLSEWEHEMDCTIQEWEQDESMTWEKYVGEAFEQGGEEYFFYIELCHVEDA